MREVSFDVQTADKWGEGLVAVEEKSAIELDVKLESVHEGILVSGVAAGQAAGICGRCLTDIVQPVEVEFQELFAYPGQEAADFEVQDDHVDLEILVRDAIVLSLPFQPVCRPDCPGLDPETGERLAENTVVEPREALDPRWAALAELAADQDSDPGEPGLSTQTS
ncbi:YceD family protein [Microbacterium caowuchunii]|uniref:DUF177 domain-containing protein n=1 Tax=Microbacterium caowuchunii TaxID=2614638 RepID=A0A5N0TJD5_9MICO|nr:DUF177 domain-containing protein [Microbacterium caowuchunii]KAA9135263.1 DUF177 domain-containing protein [Microbacterium caowuchunii]